MRRALIGLVMLAAAGSLAQEETVQPGTPAALEAMNGKRARVFLQNLNDGKLTFQPYQSTRNMTVSISKVKSLEFFPKYDKEAAQTLISAGDYAGAIEALAPMLKPYEEYMLIENNLRDIYSTLIEAYRKTGNFAKTREMANVLIASGDPKQIQRGKVNIALIAIESDDLETAGKIKEELTSEAASLYLQACIERAEKKPKVAIRTVSGIIIKHANDLEWLGPSELLCAHLYLDMMEMMGTNSVITTNSPMYTARQVKNIYSGTSVAADAKKLWISLGGDQVEARERAEKEEMERKEAEKQARREAERKAAEEKAAADAAAQEAAATDVITATEMESE